MSFRYFGTVASAMITDERFVIHDHPVLSSNNSVSDYISLKTSCSYRKIDDRTMVQSKWFNHTRSFARFRVLERLNTNSSSQCRIMFLKYLFANTDINKQILFTFLKTGSKSV